MHDFNLPAKVRCTVRGAGILTTPWTSGLISEQHRCGTFMAPATLWLPSDNFVPIIEIPPVELGEQDPKEVFLTQRV